MRNKMYHPTDTYIYLDKAGMRKISSKSHEGPYQQLPKKITPCWWVDTKVERARRGGRERESEKGEFLLINLT